MLEVACGEDPLQLGRTAVVHNIESELARRIAEKLRILGLHLQNSSIRRALGRNDTAYRTIADPVRGRPAGVERPIGEPRNCLIARHEVLDPH